MATNYWMRGWAVLVLGGSFTAGGWEHPVVAAVVAGLALLIGVPMLAKSWRRWLAVWAKERAEDLEIGADPARGLAKAGGKFMILVPLGLVAVIAPLTWIELLRLHDHR